MPGARQVVQMRRVTAGAGARAVAGAQPVSALSPAGSGPVLSGIAPRSTERSTGASARACGLKRDAEPEHPARRGPRRRQVSWLAVHRPCRLPGWIQWRLAGAHRRQLRGQPRHWRLFASAPHSLFRPCGNTGPSTPPLKAGRAGLSNEGRGTALVPRTSDTEGGRRAGAQRKKPQKALRYRALPGFGRYAGIHALGPGSPSTPLRCVAVGRDARAACVAGRGPTIRPAVRARHGRA